MDQIEQNQFLKNASVDYLEEQISLLKSLLAYALGISQDEIKASFPSLSNFYFVNNVYKSSWAIYTHDEKLPKLLFTGNFLIQGGQYNSRSPKSPFGAKALSPLTSIANTFSIEASTFKQNWALDLNLFEEESNKLKFTVNEYKEFLKLLNNLRAQWLLHLSEEGNFDFVICEFSEPSDPLFCTDLESIDSLATKIKIFFKPISQKAISLFQTLSTGTEFEGKFYSLQPGSWLRDDVLIELEKYYSEKFFNGEKVQIELEAPEYNINNPFKIQALRPTYQ